MTPNFSSRLKELRKSESLKQTEMAALLNITPRHYQQYEYGKVDPPTSTTVFLADFFEVSVDYLLGRDNHWQDTEGNIKVKVPPDIFDYGTGEAQQKD